MTAFRPLGSLSRKDIIVDHFSSMAYGETASYETLELILGVTDRAKVQQAVNRAKSELLNEHDRYIVSENSKGYRVAEPKEHVVGAIRHEGRARKERRRAMRIAKNVARERLTDAELAQNQAVLGKLEDAIVFDRRNNLRKAAKDAIEEYMNRAKRTE